MASSSPTVCGVHLVGSIPLANTEEVFTKVSEALPGRLKRLPDGETGERWNFILWQMRILKKWPLLLAPGKRRIAELDLSDEDLTDAQIDEIIKDSEENLDTEFHVPALESYEKFVQLREKGVIEKGMKFLVCLPTPLTMTMLFIRPQIWERFEKVAERALLRSLEKIKEGIRKEDLCIQWDTVIEFGVLDGSDIWGWLKRQDMEEWESKQVDGTREAIAKRLVRLVESVGDGVEVGLHLCYGDAGRKHFIQPKDTGSMVNVTADVVESAKKNVSYVHIPVPKSRDDIEYFEPLQALGSHVQAGLEVVLGLVHIHDFDGTERRIQAAGKVLPTFSVSSECGLGRIKLADVPAEEFENILKTFAAVSQRVR